MRTDWLKIIDSLAAIKIEASLARWANRAIIFFLILFALTVPHSIAAAQISFGLGLIAWLMRDAAVGHFNFKRTPIDLPLVFFLTLTIASSVFSVEPSVSMPKLKTLSLFGLIYLIATNLGPRGIKALAALLICSSLVGVGFSLTEKLWGRGMTVTEIDAASPLASSGLRPGDVIWMIDRQRVWSLETANEIVRGSPEGKTLNIEALHNGDPVPVTLTVAEGLKYRPNPLGIGTDGRTRQFRISGFSRQFLTYAEQMQIMALLAYGGLLTSLRLWKKPGARTWLYLFCALFILFALALILTASRSVVAAFIIAIFLISISVGGRIAPVIAIVLAIALGGLGYYVIRSSRQQSTMNFNDDSSSRRIAYMRAGLRVIPAHPLLGVGMDSHKRHWQEWGFPGDYITHTHSTPIQIAMDRGLPALLCYIWLIIATLAMAWRSRIQAVTARDDFGECIALGSFGAFIGFSISSLTNYNFGDSEVTMILFSLIGLVAVMKNAKHAKITKHTKMYQGFVCFVIFACLAFSPIRAQDIIKLSTDLVVIDAQVLNKKTGEIVNGLNAADFQLYEDGVKQDITHFSQDRLALSVILLIDLSASVNPVLNEIRDGALVSLNRLKQDDEVAVMAFSTKTQLVQDFTRDRLAVINKIAEIEKASVIGQGTLLYQALYDAALHMGKASNPTSRRVIVTITDNVSWDYYDFGLAENEVLGKVIESGGMVCGLVVEGSLSRAEKFLRRREDGKDLFRRRMTLDPFAAQTGGELIKSPSLEINARLAQLIDHLRTRYSLGFSPKRDRIDGSYRRLTLTLTPEAQKRVGDVVIKTKQGYYTKRRGTF